LALPKVARAQYETLLAAIRSHDHLRRIVEIIEQQHRLVFHANESVDWSLVRRSAEQILLAELATRYKSNVDNIYFALRGLETGGTPWNIALHELASRMHSYFTTPLGVVIRKDLFGDDAAFIAADAHDWIRQREGTRAADRMAEP
jgi:hypothetical protein